MNRLKDIDLREALRRKYADTPQLPADFTMKMQQRMPKPVAKEKMLWHWVAAAACLLILIGIGITLLPKEQKTTQPMLAEKPTQPKAIEERAKVVKETPIVQTKPQPVIAQAKPIIPSQQPQTEKVQPVPQTCNAGQIPTNANLHYAAYTPAEDSAYQAPCRVDEFIAKIANYNKVEAVPLKCSGDSNDTTIISTAYLFQDSKELDLFGRLLQVACWYDTKTPGYLLNFSHKQFVFCLEDLHKDMKYLWVAERIGSDRILLFSTHSPIETTVSSSCFQAYREQLTHTGINMLQF